jgi:LmeA-like phospholipid-binding
VIIDYLLSKDGLRLDQVEVSLHGVRLARGQRGFVARTATEITGTLRVTLADLSAAIARPEIVDQLLLGVPGIARPELSFVNGDDGGIRIVGSVEALGRRIPITASTHVRVAADRFIVSPVRLAGLPLIGAIPLQLPDLEIPANLPLGLRFTGVTTEPGHILLAFAGTDVQFVPVDPALDADDRGEPGS